MDDIKEKLRAFIVKNFAVDESGLKNEDSLIEKGIVDSFGFIEVMTFIEKNFGVAIGDDALQKGLGDSIDSLSEYIRQKK